MRFTAPALCLAALAAARPGIGITEEEHLTNLMIKRQGGCKEATLIFCRGTWEPGGPVGMLVGTPFSTAVRAAVGMSKIDVKGVSYDAGVVGYLIGGDPAGATTMAKMVTQTLAKCPNTKIVLGGYSQGAQVAHLAAAKLSESEKSKVAAVVVFGDPYKGKAIPGISSDKIHTICAADDMICYGIPLPIGAHLAYGGDTKNIQAGAQFIKEKVAGHSSSGGGSSDSGSSSKGKGAAPKGKGSPKESKSPKPSGGKGGAPKAPSGGKGGAPKGKGKGKESSGGDDSSSSSSSESKESSEPKESKEMEGMEGMDHGAHGAERMTMLDEMAAEAEPPLGAENNPALKGVVESLLRAAYANVGVEPAMT